MHRTIHGVAFLAGLIAIVWVGAGYVGSSALALVVTMLIGAVYVAGAVELLRFHRATTALAAGLDAIPEDLAHPGTWIAGLPPSLQNAVRLRLEGERAGLPGPVVTPYLVGLLVLLGMLGTFLGLVVTLKGAVIALEGTTNLEAIRASLAAPVKGLGVAFGTSVAGVAASAMLGLLSALCRRERLKVGQVLDARIATTLRGFSVAHQRQETFRALQQQAAALPELAAKMEAMMAQMDRQSRELNERLVGEQERFYGEAKTAYGKLADSLDRSLRTSLSESARIAGETIQPVVAKTMAGIASETAALQTRVADAVQAQLDGIGQRFDATAARVGDTWAMALASHERTSESLSRELQEALRAYADSFEARSAALLASVEAAHAAMRNEFAGTLGGVAQQTAALQAGLAEQVEKQLDGVAVRFDGAMQGVAESWAGAVTRQEQAGERLAVGLERSLQGFAEHFTSRSAELLASVGAKVDEAAEALAARDEARLVRQAQALDALAGTLQREWRQAGEQALARQEGLVTTLGETAQQVAASAQAQASATIAEVSRLLETVADAPRAAAEVVAQLRGELSASMARDNALLAERARILETLDGLLGTIDHASTEQRAAIDELVASSSAMLERAGSHLDERLEREAARMSEVAGHVASGAIEVASLGEAFGAGVQVFSDANERLLAALDRIEGALEKSMARSDEQLAYYVAQAREVIDLSIMSQRQIVEDLQQLPGRQPSFAGEA